MAMHKDFPTSPHEILKPDVRWFPADETLRDTSYEKLMPPLVPELRQKVFEWRNNGYPDVSDTSRTLLNWWFKTPHPIPHADGTIGNFEYYFAQRESVETVIYLHEFVKVKDKHDLLRFDTRGVVPPKLIEETWRRYVVKMATGSGKTKTMSLLLAWSYFHKKYEEDSDLSKNFLVIAPNIIVLDRLRTDFDGLKIFSEDPVLPDNGTDGRNWRSDFQLTLHIQDEVGPLNSNGNIFLTNIHRVYDDKTPAPTAEDENSMDYFLGKKPQGKTTDSGVDLGRIIRDIDELVVINDEAHHIHDSKLTWFKSIGDIHNKLKQKGSQLALQIDVTATPKHNNGAIFVQTIADYPLVEAITQNVVKHPVLPDSPSRSKLSEKQSSVFTEKYGDYINLGVTEWRKVYPEHEKLGKKAVLFVMTDDTKNCDAVAEYLETTFPEFKDAVLTIHTNRNGEISESASSKASKDELEKLRKQSNEIDSWSSPYKAIVSVLMLKEGWDVRNVTTIVGLRAFAAPSNILPEQTLGRGLRRMYPGSSGEEYVSVVGTEAFMDFVESIQTEGVELEKRAMGTGTEPVAPMIIEVEEDGGKDIDKLDIEIPVLTPRAVREYKNLNDLDLDTLQFQISDYYQYSEEEQREIVFRDITTDEVTHTTVLDGAISTDYRSVIGYFAQTILKDLRLYAAYDVLYPKVQEFVQDKLFGKFVDLEDANTLRNLSEPNASRTIFETFKSAINALTIRDTGNAEIRDSIKIRNVRPFVVKDQKNITAKKSVFNKIVGDSVLELRFAQFLERVPDVVSYAKNYTQVNFKIDYIDATGNIANYIPDFLVKVSDTKTFVVETKGLEDLDDPLKIKRLRQWCADVNASHSDVEFDFVYVDQEKFDRLTGADGRSQNELATFSDLVSSFTAYKE
ncbi:DEAD/DEAH box helicase [Candidatus Puniceispirillum marinum]|uniref:Type III restriction protein res subunit n=1 Tax=Puniceispirillum marinum (strain IMCC1322) TaxID=488538 RepID=D5BTC8_PUNMI|nr:DEAD/DEAH box helicase family protein [Candidatus Puniceispirillum marinum]ADE39525.1 type III restriction protein res subunit [Candidatus Puniceispirillum marinum IMCC1322]